MSNDFSVLWTHRYCSQWRNGHMTTTVLALRWGWGFSLWEGSADTSSTTHLFSFWETFESSMTNWTNEVLEGGTCPLTGVLRWQDVGRKKSGGLWSLPWEMTEGGAPWLKSHTPDHLKLVSGQKDSCALPHLRSGGIVLGGLGSLGILTSQSPFWVHMGFSGSK